MAFVDALYDGVSVLEGVVGKRARRRSDLSQMLLCGRGVIVTSLTFNDVLEETKPDALVDARMRKREQPEPQRGLAPLTVGLGPNWSAGENADIAIETAWGDDLGKIVLDGPTRSLGGEPRSIEGYGRERFVYAPVSGTFSTRRQIGDLVGQGEVVGQLDGADVKAPLSGRLRGLAHDGASVQAGAKILEIGAGAEADALTGIGERPLQIAKGVLSALETRSQQRGERNT